MLRLTHHQSAWMVVCLVALVVRLGVAVWWQSRLGPQQKFYFGDSESYWVLAQAIARGDPYEFGTSERRVFRTPGYPLLLSPLFVAWGGEPPVMAARVLGCVLGVAAVALLGWWTTWLFDTRTGLVVGVIAALYPGAVAMGAFVLTEAPFVACMLAHLICWSRAWRASTARRTVIWGLAGGVAAGAAVLIRPSWLLFLPFAVAASLVGDRHRGRQLAIGSAMAAGLAVCLAPWWAHNYRVTGRFVATSLQAGASLYDGWNPQADGSSDMRFVEEFTRQERAAPVVPGDDVFEYRLDRRMRNAALVWAREHPGRVLELAWIKLVRIWNVWPNESAFRQGLPAVAVFATYTPLLLLSIVGAWSYSRAGWPYVLAWLPAVYLTLLHVVFVGSIRYREPAMLALMPLAAAVVARSAPAQAADASAASRQPDG